MALPSSGTIKMSQVRDELKKTGPISLGNADVRKLGGKPSGTIKMSDLYGKSNYIFYYKGYIFVDRVENSLGDVFDYIYFVVGPVYEYGYVTPFGDTIYDIGWVEGYTTITFDFDYDSNKKYNYIGKTLEIVGLKSYKLVAKGFSDSEFPSNTYYGYDEGLSYDEFIRLRDEKREWEILIY